jgi:glycosyltransferase involved in cell wall biosynthesis
MRLALAMIVKDEAVSITKTVESVRDLVDTWVVVDTGSTDGTQDLIAKAFEGVPGRIETAPFVDYSTTRNLALELAEKEADWVFMLSGGESVQDSTGLRAFLEQATADAIAIRIKLGPRQYDSTRIHRSTAKWRYRGRTHEVLVSPEGLSNSVQRAPGLVLHEKFAGEWGKELARWKRDVELLLPDAERGDPRSCFYLAASYDCLGDIDSAERWYRRRHELGGWFEEAWEAQLRVASIAARRNFDGEGLAKLLEAHNAAPHRAEPLHTIAQHYYAAGKYPLAVMFADAGLALPYPERDRLFVDADVYAWKLHDVVAISAWRYGNMARGYVAAAAAVAGLKRLHGTHDARMDENLAWYRSKVGGQP